MGVQLCFLSVVVPVYSQPAQAATGKETVAGVKAAGTCINDGGINEKLVSYFHALMKFLLKFFTSSKDSGFEFVYVNQDGTVREISPNEREYLEQEFSPGDSGRPYIKSTFKSLDGWGSMSGFLPRKKVPPDVIIDPVNPQYDSLVAEDTDDFLEEHRAAGDIIETNPNGSITCTPNPELSKRERFERMRRFTLESQKKREMLGKVFGSE